MAKNHCEAKFEPELKHTERTRAVAGKREKNGAAKVNRSGRERQQMFQRWSAEPQTHTGLRGGRGQKSLAPGESIRLHSCIGNFTSHFSKSPYVWALRAIAYVDDN